MTRCGGTTASCPTLELKKQQLQREVRRVETALREHVARERALLEHVRPWVKLLSAWDDLGAYVRIEAVELESVNIAGVTVPSLAGVRFVRPVIDFFETPAWLEDAVVALSELTAIRAERRVLDRQKALLGEELRITVQRVNLFEKVMIPRTLETIRVIRIALAMPRRPRSDAPSRQEQGRGARDRDRRTMIVKMKRLTLVCLTADRDRVLAALRGVGVVHVAESRPPAGEELESLRARLADAERARDALPVDVTGAASDGPADGLVAEVLDIVAQQRELGDRARELRSELHRYEAFGEFDVASVSRA